MNKISLITIMALAITSCTNQEEIKLKEIISSTESKIKPLQKEANSAYWEGTITGSAQSFDIYAKATIKITEIYSDKTTFEELKQIKESGKIKTPELIRELEIIYNTFLGNQADTSLLNAIIKKGAILEQKYAEFRANVKGKLISDNEIEKILSSSTNNFELEEAWKAHKKIGELVSQDVIELVKMRNDVAKSIGFENYHTMSLELSGQDPKELISLFDELDSLTLPAFIETKNEMDSIFSIRYGVPKEKLMPWNYQDRFFQEAPQLYNVDLDKYYKGKNLEELTSKYYQSIGLDISNILKSSDLYEKPGKNQHAYCIDIDSERDIRVLCNISDNEKWMGTMLHEFGHAVYSYAHDNEKNPYLFRNAAHTFTTEAVAMIFGRLSRNPEWMEKNLGITREESISLENDLFKSLRLQQLVFSRWTQVMFRFEKEMYNNPDQDLNQLWWNLVEKYQLLKKPEGRNSPDWASKVHIALYPCYYHNYQLGELFASQMHYYIVNKITKSGNIKNDSYTGNKDVGTWMSKEVMEPGMRYKWNEMIEKSTGEKLTAKYFAKQFFEN